MTDFVGKHLAGDPRDRALPIGAHALIGDGRTAALVRTDGAVVWLCLPRFDSPSVFAAILDGRAGGLTSIEPVSGGFRTQQRYEPGTNVLETRIEADGGALCITDVMPLGEGPALHRHIRCDAGEVPVRVLLDPRPDYGRGEVALDIMGDRVGVDCGGEGRLVVSLPSASWAPDGRGGLASEMTLGAGDRATLVLAWEATGVAAVDVGDVDAGLADARAKWRAWGARTTYEGPFGELVERSALALGLLAYRPTGGIVAAPTTSLPEWLGGRRNWDYRYVWLRDGAMIAGAMARVGHGPLARRFFEFARDTADPASGLRVMSAVDGAPVPEERILGHLGGFGGSAPVRIGNGARDQLQIDTAGAILDAAYNCHVHGGGLPDGAWPELERVVSWVARTWREPDHGIWEPRHGRRHNVYSKVMSWVALDRGGRLAEAFGADVPTADWTRQGAAIEREVLERAAHPDGGLASEYGGRGADSTLLRLGALGFLPPADPRLRATIARVRQELGDHAFLHRYRNDDGVGGEEGAFVLCGFWLVCALARAGQIEEAHAVMEAHCAAANHVGLLAEEVDPATGAQLGNFPQGFSHLGVIEAALALQRL